MNDQRTQSGLSADCDVYLRIKPATGHDKLPLDQQNATTLNLIRNAAISETFNFTEIFNENSTQTEVFNHSIRKRVVDLINGKSSTILTYGTSGTGKWHTMFGTIYEPGIVAHATRLLFSSVRCSPEPWYKVTGDDLIVALNEEERVMENKWKRESLDSCKDFVSQYVRQRLLTKCTSQVFKCNDQEYSADVSLMSVWISTTMVTIDHALDYLNADLSSLTVSFREDGSAYLPDSNFVHIATVAEAYELLIGKRLITESGEDENVNIIFTIKLLKYQKQNAANTVSVSTLTFCVLTKGEIFSDYEPTEKERLRWCNSCDNVCILEKYIKTVYEDGNKAFWPFWESVLTLLLRKPLLGQEAITFLVTIDINRGSEDETIATLKTSSMMKRHSTLASTQSSDEGVGSEDKH